MRGLSRAVRAIFVALTAALLLWAVADVGLRAIDGWRQTRDQVTLRILFWGDNRERAIIDELIAAFEADHPGVKVEPLHATDFDTKLKTMLASGDPPDAFYLPNERLFGMLAEQGLLADLEPFVNAQRQADPGWVGDFYPQLLDAFRWDDQAHRAGSGVLYGIPKGFTTTVCYVNLDLFAAAGVPVPYDGWTWDEYADAAARIKALGTVPGRPNTPVYGGVITTWDWALMNHVWTFGGDYFAGDFQHPTVTDPRTLDALRFIQDARFDSGIVYNATGIAQSEEELFRLGQVGIIGALGRWKVPTFRQVDFRWDVVPLPHAPGVEPVSPIVTVSWSMSAASEHPEETWALITYLCGPRGQTMIAELGLEIPSLRSVAQSPAFHAPGMLPANSALFIEQLGGARLIQWPLQGEFTRFLNEELQALALSRGVRTPEEGAARVEARWAEFLSSPLNQIDLPAMPWRTLIALTALALLVALAALILIARRQKLGRLDATEERTGWSFIALWVVGFLTFTLGPMAVSLLLSLTRWQAVGPLSEASFVGLGNYTRILSADESFRQSIWVTLYYTALAVPITQILAIGVALLMNLRVRAIGWFRTAYFVPSVVSGVALVTLWITIFDNSRGALNAALRPLLAPFGLNPPDWFGVDARWFASPALVIMTAWGIGGAMVIYLAGLKNVPRSLYEAACLDGAGPVRRFWAVTLPMISPIVFFQVVMAVIASFQIFTQAFVIRGATSGTASTNPDLLFYVLNLYDEAFRFHNMGYASALAWILFAAILGLTLLIFRGSKGLVHYEGLR